MRVDSAHMRSRNTQNCVLDGNTCTVFRPLNRLLNGRDRLLQRGCFAGFLLSTPAGDPSFRGFCERVGETDCLPPALTGRDFNGKLFGDSRLNSAAGFTPAEIAAFATAAESAGWRAAPRRS